jgi:hypothetical protein
MEAYNAKVFSSQIIMDTIPAIRKLLETELKSELMKATSVAATSDGWSDARLRKYVSLTLHFCDDQWNLRSVVADVFPLQESHTIHVLSQAIEQHADKWLGNEQLLTAHVTDGGANFEGASNALVGENDHIHCFAHKLQLVVHDVMTQDNLDFKTDIEKVKAFVDAIMNHTSTRNLFRELQK